MDSYSTIALVRAMKIQEMILRAIAKKIVGWFGLGLILFGIASATHPKNSAGYFLIFPAIWIAMVVGGVHSAGFWSFVIGLAIPVFWNFIREKLFSSSVLARERRDVETAPPPDYLLDKIP
jgi:Na+/H+ antiporter NhaA